MIRVFELYRQSITTSTMKADNQNQSDKERTTILNYNDLQRQSHKLWSYLERGSSDIDEDRKNLERENESRERETENLMRSVLGERRKEEDEEEKDALFCVIL